MSTAIVTGGAGFLGSHLCDRLLAEGHRVICVDNLDTGSLENIEHIRDGAFAFVQHDVTGHLEISEPVDYVALPGSEGELGIYPQHVPLVTGLKPGELTYTQEGRMSHLAIGTGFVEITGQRVSVLTDMALGEADIDEKATEEALKRAQEHLESIKHDPHSEEVALTMGMIQKSMAQLHVKRRRRNV